MSLIYNIILVLAKWTVRVTSALGRNSARSKFMKFVHAQNCIIRNIVKSIDNGKDAYGSGATYWFHCASLGEYAVVRPLISELKKRENSRIIITFFSSTGVEALEDNHPDIDFIFYLPLDTRRNARRFIDAVNPDAAIFSVSEYWINYLNELKRRNIPTYLVNAKITRRSQFFRWYGKIYRKSLQCYNRIFVIDEESRELLLKAGFDRAQFEGNPLFDNAITKSATPWNDPVIERFIGNMGENEDVIIAGSVHDINDINLVDILANKIIRQDKGKIIIVPHEITPTFISAIKARLEGKCCFYSDCPRSGDMENVRCMIVDKIGILAYLYRYGTMAYIGGGFTRYLHSLVEAVVYGIPVSFGPCIQRKVTPSQLLKLGIGRIVNSAEDLIQWYEEIADNNVRIAEFKEIASKYIKANKGATNRIADIIEKDETKA